MNIVNLINRINKISKFDYIEIFNLDDDNDDIEFAFYMDSYKNPDLQKKLREITVKDFEADYTRISSVLKIYI